jgi:hypothetical protein
MSEVEVFHTTDPTSNEVADAITKLDYTEPTQYRIEFESETIHRPTAKYIVHRIGHGIGGKPMLEFVVKRKNGARFTIDSNPTGDPMIINQFEQSPDKKERLLELRILGTEANMLDLAKQWLR